jgi:hypothetical protein
MREYPCFAVISECSAFECRASFMARDLLFMVRGKMMPTNVSHSKVIPAVCLDLGAGWALTQNLFALLGVDGGIAKMVAMSNIGLALTSPSGWGVAVSISYDFNPKPTGMSIVIGGRANYNIMQGGAVTAAPVFAQVAWK